MRSVPMTASSLLAVGLFEKLDEQLRGDLVKNCRGHVFEPREVILSRDSPSKDVYFILSGSVHITNYSSSGKEVTFRDQGAGEAVGILSAIDGEPRSAHAIAREATTIARMTAEKFKKLLRDYPLVNISVMHYLASLVRLLSERVIEFSTMTVNQRLYAELLRLGNLNENNGDVVEISCMPTHADLASRIATHREAVSRELKHLSNDGIISKCGSTVTISNVSELESRIAQALPDISCGGIHL